MMDMDLLSLEDKRRAVAYLVKVKEFDKTMELKDAVIPLTIGSDIHRAMCELKLWRAVIELGELGHLIKNGYNRFSGVLTPHEYKKRIAEEWVDALFFMLDAVNQLELDIDLDTAFREKLEKNLKRENRYGEASK